jgi:hypothetical protein
MEECMSGWAWIYSNHCSQKRTSKAIVKEGMGERIWTESDSATFACKDYENCKRYIIMLDWCTELWTHHRPPSQAEGL